MAATVVCKLCLTNDQKYLRRERKAFKVSIIASCIEVYWTNVTSEVIAVILLDGTALHADNEQKARKSLGQYQAQNSPHADMSKTRA